MAGSKDKNGGHSSAKMRRITSQQGGSNLREVTNASAAASTQPTEPTAPSVRSTPGAPNAVQLRLLRPTLANSIVCAASMVHV